MESPTKQTSVPPSLDLSIIVVNWNTRDLLAQSLQSVYDTVQGLDFEVFVVDNGSSDDSAAMVQGRFPRAQLIENEENVGFARANNQAIELCRGRHILLLNSDAQLTNRAASGMVDYLDEHPEAGIVGCRLVHPDGTPQFCYGRFPTLWRECLGLMGLHRWDMSHWDDTESLEVDWVSGACLMIRWECLNAVGGMDENFFMFGEEVDLCYRTIRAGWRVVLVPGSPVIHVRAGSSGKTSCRVSRLYRGKLRYFQKHCGRFRYILLRFLIRLACWAKVVTYGLSGLWNLKYRSSCRFWLNVVDCVD